MISLCSYYLITLKYIMDGTAKLIMHPARYQILQSLRSSPEPMFVEQIAKHIHVHPRMVSHHLDVLEKQELVECNYEIINVNGSRRGVAVRLCNSTIKADEVFNDIKEALEKK